MRELIELLLIINENARVSHLLRVDGVENPPTTFTSTYDLFFFRSIGAVCRALTDGHTQMDATENITTPANPGGKNHIRTGMGMCVLINTGCLSADWEFLQIAWVIPVCLFPMVISKNFCNEWGLTRFIETNCVQLMQIYVM